MFGQKKQTRYQADTPMGIVEELAFESLKERKKTRRWSIFFRTLFALYLLAFFIGFFWKLDGFGINTTRHTAVVDIAGVIEAGGDVDADAVIAGIDNAFANEGSVGVVLNINSPGGSAVQSGRIYDELIRQRAMHPDKPLYAVVDDICASGGYYIAAAADKIYANRASLIGSIGVLMSSFGFVDTMEKLGVERRLITAGENKAMLDPFSPLDEKTTIKARELVASIHQQFINAVRKGRGDRLKESDDTYSGTVWTGEQSLEIGLIDELADLGHVSREILNAPDIVNYTPRPSLVEEISDKVGVNVLKLIGIETRDRGVQLR